ncbi:hypothetical protein EDF57_111108 [Novosphingobium sp. PhB55]|nr:hypothetical protein EDF57_111108 [Novosphingobium sp. PhB55]
MDREECALSGIKLGKLPDRTAVKLSVLITPDLHRDLQDYAAAYAAAYGHEVAVADLVPAILSSFIDSDRSFRRRKKEG